MSSDEDGVVVAVPDDEDLVVAHDYVPVVGSGGTSIRGRRRTLKAEDSFWTWLAVDTLLPSPARLKDVQVARGLESLIDSPPGVLAAVGVARCRWIARKGSVEGAERYRGLLPVVPDRDPVVLGYIDYDVTDVHLFDDPVLFQNRERVAYIETLKDACCDFSLGGGLGTVAEVMSAQEMGAALELPLSVASSMLLGEVVCVRSVRLTRQLRFRGIIAGKPPRGVVRHYWKEWMEESKLLEAPAPPPIGVASSSQISPPFIRHPRKRGFYGDDDKLKKGRRKSRSTTRSS